MLCYACFVNVCNCALLQSNLSKRSLTLNIDLFGWYYLATSSCPQFVWKLSASTESNPQSEKKTSSLQVVDMRWGVRDEATDDHMTTELCMREIKNCQRLSMGPNFVVFLGQKYGYRYLSKHFCNCINGNTGKRHIRRTCSVLIDKILDQCVLPVMTYGAETWSLTMRLLRKLHHHHHHHQPIAVHCWT